MTTIAAVISLTLSGATSKLLDAAIEYNDVDPLAVTIIFYGETSEKNVEWVFARSILIDGLKMSAGSGDVQVWLEDAATAVIRLASPDGTALLRTRIVPLQRFVKESLDLIPEGKEFDHLDTGAELDNLLAE